jgi:hypothetical protein
VLVLNTLKGSSKNSSSGAPPVLFFSITDGNQRAHVVRASGGSFEDSWKIGQQACLEIFADSNPGTIWLKVDWITDFEELTWRELGQIQSRTKRNYFRYGLSLSRDFSLALLEQELNSAAAFYTPSPTVQLNTRNFANLFRSTFRDLPIPALKDNDPVWIFSTEAVFAHNDQRLDSLPGGSAPVALDAPRHTRLEWNHKSLLNSGRRQVPDLGSDEITTLIKSGSSFLASQVKSNGEFVYGHFPCFAKNIPNYNSLRHASTVYAMLESWELTRDEKLLDATKKALTYLTEKLIRNYEQSDGTLLAYNVDINGEIKLGANGVSILALVKYEQLTGDSKYRPLMEQLALGIGNMQHPTTGGFVHVLNVQDLSVKEEFRIVYYDGEAAFGLIRLYGLTGDERWLQIVEKAFDYFLQSNHWKHHDHWLSYCVNELTKYKPEEKYFRFGVQNISGHLKFIMERETTYPTLLELAMAFSQMLERIKDLPKMAHVLEGLDLDYFQKALKHRAEYLLNGFFWPELAMYFEKPNTVVGSFFIRHHSFRVRIDDIEHYLSGYVAYQKNQRLRSAQRRGTVKVQGDSDSRAGSN